MEWLFTILIVAVVAVIYVAVQKNSPANRQARAASEALSRVGAAWDRAPADKRDHILSEVGMDSASARNPMIVKPWAQLGIQTQTTIALRSGLVEQFVGHSTAEMGQDATTASLKVDEIAYFEAVRDLAMRLSRSVPLPEWATGAPTDYTPREIESIERFRLAMIRSTFGNDQIDAGCAAVRYRGAVRKVDRGNWSDSTGEENPKSSYAGIRLG